MKKLLIATAAMAVVAGAQAQSSVTVYGVVDMNMSSNDITGSGSQSGLGVNALSTSRVGLKGTEDLGGGLKAEFQLEGALNPTTGQLGTTSKTIGTTAAANQTSQAATLFNREAWIGLTDAKLGSIRVGRTDISGAQGLDSTVGQAGNLSDASGNLGADSAGIIRYTTPTFAGFSVQAAYLNASPTTVSSATSTVDATAGEATTGAMKSIYAQYEAGNLGVYAGQTTNKISATYDQKETTYGVKYDFGVVAVGAYQSVRAASTAALDTSNGDIKQTIFSASAPVALLGSGVKAHAVYAKISSDKAERTASILAGDKIADGDKTTFALTKALSKRTTAYVAYVDTQYKTQATDNADSKLYAVGVSHNF
jgi:predicted porin